MNLGVIAKAAQENIFLVHGTPHADEVVCRVHRKYLRQASYNQLYSLWPT